MTPLQLGALVAAIANGGTLYYLQHPTTKDEISGFEPKVKRKLDIARFVPDLQDGMAGVFTTAQRAACGRISRSFLYSERQAPVPTEEPASAGLLPTLRRRLAIL